jgi:hypothetical protein
LKLSIPSIGLFLFYFLPLPLHRYLGAGSFAAGLLLASLIIVSSKFIQGEKTLPLRPWILAVYIVSLVLVISAQSMAIGQYTEISRSSLTLLALFVCIVAAGVLVQSIKLSDFYSIMWFLLTAQTFSGILGWISVIPLRTSLLFNEPSHFGLFIMPLVTLYAFTQVKISRIFAMMVVLTFCVISFTSSIVLGSLALCILAMAIRGRLSIRLWILIACTSVPLIYLVILNQGYLLSRLDFDSETNATTLTLVAAYQRLSNIWSDYTPYGIGIQNFGNYPVNSSAFDLLEAVDGRVGLHDSAVTFAKLGSELGIFMVALPILASVCVFRAIRFGGDKAYIIASFSIALLIELFIRGVGYFSPTFLIALPLIFSRLLKLRLKNIVKFV